MTPRGRSTNKLNAAFLVWYMSRFFNGRPATKALVLSFLIHAAFLGVAQAIWMGGAVESKDNPPLFRVRPVSEQGSSVPGQEIVKGYFRNLQFQNPHTPAPLSHTRATLKGEIQLPDVTRTVDHEKIRVSESSQMLQPKDEFVYKEKVVVEQRKVEKTQTDQKVKFFEPGGPGIAINTKGVDIEIPEPFMEKMEAFTPEAVSRSKLNDFISGFQGEGQGSGKGISSIGMGTSVEGLDEFMSVKATTWQDPSDGQKYFELIIYPGRDAARLATMPKEVVFLVDASLSIQEQRIEQFREAILYCIHHLNPGDRFNILIFRDRITRLFDNSQEANDTSLEMAARYLRKMDPGDTTDIYEAFLESISTPPTLIPSYIVLLSDGRPTHGITSSAKLIEEISRMNKQVRSIFAFTGGRKVNRYLLDFLSYQNRGWSEFALTTRHIPEKGAELYDKIRYPLLIRMRYQFSGFDSTEVYPKYLPDFYRNAAFVLYGKYQEEKEFSVRLVGEIAGETKEIIFSVNLKNAESGSLKVGRFWGFNKVYHLISKMTLEGESQSIRDEIRALSKKFSITTPYDL